MLTTQRIVPFSASASGVVLFPIDISDSAVDPLDAECRIRVNSSGAMETYISQDGSYLNPYDWLLSGAAADYEVRFDITSGSTSAGSSATGSWLGCGTSREWKRSATTIVGSPQLLTGTLSLRRVSGATLASTTTSQESEVV